LLTAYYRHKPVNVNPAKEPKMKVEALHQTQARNLPLRHRRLTIGLALAAIVALLGVLARPTRRPSPLS
jgi:hypothetical protein